MARRQRMPVWIVVGLAFAVGGGAGVYGWTEVQARDAALAAVRAERADLRGRLEAVETERDAAVAELEAALRIGQRLSARVDALEADLQEARAMRLDVREVRGTADFPIQRAMAEAGDTVAGFAGREGTTEEIVRALNPWLGEATELDGFQTLWVPKRR